MKLYSIARPNDLLQATGVRFRKRLSAAVNEYLDLIKPYHKDALGDAVERACAAARDIPPMRAWIHTLSQMNAFRKGSEPVPHSALVGHVHVDGPTVERLIELLGWQALGASFNGNEAMSLKVPAAPPNLLPMGDLGVFMVGERWPTSGAWTLTTSEGLAVLTGPQFAATSKVNDIAWVPHVGLKIGNLDAVVPLCDPALMNRDFQEFPVVRSRPYTLAWATTVMQAAETISAYSASAAECVRAFVRCIVPLMCTDDAVGSASREEAAGLIFLPACDLLDQVTECLLHETMHQYLFRIEECGAIFTDDTDTEERYYSPWRHDPRPLRMTLHGAFVFAAVADLYLWDDAPIALKIDHAECTRRAYWRAKQVRVALDIVHRNARLTHVGEVVLDAIEHDLARIFDRAKPTYDDCFTLDGLLKAHGEQHAGYAR